MFCTLKGFNNILKGILLAINVFIVLVPLILGAFLFDFIDDYSINSIPTFITEFNLDKEVCKIGSDMLEVLNFGAISNVNEGLGMMIDTLDSLLSRIF